MRTLIILVTLTCGVAYADDPITIATWNVGLINRSVSDLNLEAFANEVDPDILVLNEVKTIGDVQEIRARLEREEDHIAISNFENGTGNLEVAILSRFPLDDVVEFDRSPESGQTSPKQETLEQVDLPGIADIGVGRGFLVANIPSLNYVVIGTHLKSSRGKKGPTDHSNAQKRELVAAAIAQHVSTIIEDDPEATVFVAGDVNVGVSDKAKNGTVLTSDKFSGQGDRYDETHALLMGGLVDELRMKSLAKDLDGTFVGNENNIPEFPGTGAIDVIYVIGADAEKFKKAKRAADRHGSDHLAVYSSTSDSPISTESTIRIKKVLPNPEGRDAGNETVTLENLGPETSIRGWKFNDAAGHHFDIPDTDLPAEALTTIQLTVNSMPLTNTGDTILLLNENGGQVGPAFSYSKRDVKPGKEIEQ